MANIHNLCVYREARELIRSIQPITAVGEGYAVDYFCRKTATECTLSQNGPSISQ